jgi:protein kinase-like protein
VGMAELTPGTVFAGCRVEATIGRGGMGLIYRAIDLRLDRPVAIKLIAGERATQREFRERFERESRLTAAIDHPNVIPIYAAGEEDGHLYLVMRYVDGTDLHALLAEAGRLAPSRAAAIVAQVAQGLDAAHAAGLVHRDVKPANVLLAGGHVYLSDFGITRVESADTRLTESGGWIGTVDFMAPEHLRAERTDARSDVYALGCVLYTALTGTPPFRRATVPATVLAHLEDPAPRPSAVAVELEPFDAVVARALAKDPNGRFLSAGDLGAATLAAAAGEPATRPMRSVATGMAAPDDQTRRMPPGTPDGPGSGRAAPDRTGETRRLAPAAPAATLQRPHPAVAPRRPPPDPPRRAARPASAEAAPPAEAPPAARAAAAAETPPAARASATPEAPPAVPAAEPAPRAAPPPPPAAEPVVRHRARSRRRGVLASLLLAAALAAAAIIVALVTARASRARTGPVGAGEVRSVAQAFARAYAREDEGALRRTLTPGVTRVSPTGVQRGRGAVVAEYVRQFKGYKTKGYTLRDLRAGGGDAGRASAGYTVTLAGRPAITGHLVLAVVRDDGAARIRLIAAEPRG